MYKRRLLLLVAIFVHVALCANVPRNFVETIIPLTASKSVEKTSTRVDRQYFDGIGRKTLNLKYEGDASKQSIGTYQTYDRSNLPISLFLSTPIAEGSEPFDSSDFIQLSRDYYGIFEDPITSQRYSSYGQPRLIEEHTPGSDWIGRYKTYSYGSNLKNDVLLISLSETGAKATYYSEHKLKFTKVTDEDGNSKTTFTDAQERTVLERQCDSANKIVAETYYVYNIYGDLQAVVPPMAAEMLRTDKAISKYYTDAYLFQYKYDIDHRPIVIKEPGVEAVYCVYDRFGNLAMKQDGRQRTSNEWTVRKFDEKMRPILEGIIKSTRDHQYWIDFCDSNYFIEQRDNDNESNLFYSNTSGPAGFEPYMSWLYDDYSFLTYEDIPTFPDGYDDTKALKAIGLCTATAMKATTSSGVKIRATVYDREDRPIAESSFDYFGNDFRHTVFHRYNHTGEEIERIERLEERAERTTTSLREVAFRYNFDARGRVLTTEWKSKPTEEWKKLTTNSYNEIGQLVKEQNAIATTTYGYNVRGSLTSINSPLFSQKLYYGPNPHGGNDNYAGKICASSEFFNSRPDDTALNFNYTYDALGRLINASDTGGNMDESFNFDANTNITKLKRNYLGLPVTEARFFLNGNQIDNIEEGAGNMLAGQVPSFNGSAPVYDENGFIIADPYRDIESVSFHEYKNLPKQVKFTDGNTLRFTYQPDGTCTEIAETERQLKVTLRVNANGDTIRSERYVTSTSSRRYYGAFERVGTVWRYHTPFGHYTFNDSTHHYYARDYMGSTRAVYSPRTFSGSIVRPLAFEVGEASNLYRVEQQVRYFPSGVPVELLPSTPATDRLHHGKPWLDRNGFGHYFNSARLHDALTARFNGPDPLTSSNTSVSPYAHCNGDPVNNIDPDGNREFPVDMTYNGGQARHENNFHEPRCNGTRLHQGVDINIGHGDNDLGAPVYSTHEGKVVLVAFVTDDYNAGGTRIRIQSYDGTVSTSYMHLSAVAQDVKLGAYISEGQQIGNIGKSGFHSERSYAAHLHYEISLNNQNINPAKDSKHLIDAQQLIQTRPDNTNYHGTLSELVVYGKGAVKMPEIPIEIKPINLP